MRALDWLCVCVFALACVLISSSVAMARPTPRHQQVLPPQGNNGLPNNWVWGCANISASLPFCDTTLTIDQRVDDLIGRLAQHELLGLMGASNSTPVDNCNCMDNGVPRLGIPGYENIVETNTAVASACIAAGICATEFPCPTNMAATFNRSTWTAKGSVISTEMRAFNNYGWWRGSEAPYAKISLQGYGPNINIIRDPRFGRNGELPSEDPFLAGSYAVHYVRAAQEGDDPRYQKMVAGLKHFALYSVETNRGSFIPKVSTFDLHDTYLRQYKMALLPRAVGGAEATGMMCSYSGLNGVPSCANDELLNQLARGEWQRPDLLVGTDCGAISNMIDQNHYAKDDLDAAAKTLNGGADVDMGDGFFPPPSQGGNGALAAAIAANLTTWSRVITSVRRILTPRFRMGLFDPLADQEYTNIGVEQINTTAHHNLVLDIAEQSLVLLKNQQQTLPFDRTKTTAVIGPHSVSQGDLFDDYRGDQTCVGGNFDCVRTVGETFQTTQAQARLGHVYNHKGVDLDSNDTSGIPAALAAAQQADQIVLCLGIGIDQEHEGIDRVSITLPGLQESFASKILALGKPTVIVLINAGGIAIDNLIPHTPAIIEAFYPAMRGGEALYNSIFGLTNRWGKLPVTLYKSSFIHEQDLTNFDMTTKPGRTYRYYTNTPAFPFGFGLSYTTFSFFVNVSETVDATVSVSTSAATFPVVSVPGRFPLTLSVTVLNTGLVCGDEVLLVYHRVGTSIAKNVTHPLPIKALVDFQRLTIEPLQTQQVTFTLQKEAVQVTDSSGARVTYSGEHELLLSDGVQPDQVIKVWVP